jgi:curli biogenesis system outer membrane secretion channel CsgG
MMAFRFVRPWIAPALLGALLVGCGGGSPPAAGVPSSAPPVEAPSAENYAAPMPDAGKVEHVTITASGRGASLGAAVNQALLLAVQQVNGTTIDATSVQLEGRVAVQLGDRSLDIRSSAFADLVASQTHGNVSNFRVLSQSEDKKTGDYEVSIEARIAKFAKPESAARLRVAVAEFRTEAGSFTVDTTRIGAGEIAQKVRENLTNALTKTGRIAVLDREFSAETDAELAQIASGKMDKDDLSRIGQRLASDYLLVGRIERFGYERRERALRASGRTLVSHSGGAALTLRLINVTTGQIEQADTAAIDLPETEPTTLGTSVNAERIAADLTAELSDQAAQKIIRHLFPITVVSVEGDDVVLSQGGAAMVEGKHYEIVARGKELKDPQTGQSLGRIEKPCCVVLVTKVTPQLSYGTLVKKQIDVASSFGPGALEVRGEIAVASSVAPQPAQTPVAQTQTAPAAAAISKEKPKRANRDSDW